VERGFGALAERHLPRADSAAADPAGSLVDPGASRRPDRPVGRIVRLTKAAGPASRGRGNGRRHTARKIVSLRHDAFPLAGNLAGCNPSWPEASRLRGRAFRNRPQRPIN
jgi:hypothetical protein